MAVVRVDQAAPEDIYRLCLDGTVELFPLWAEDVLDQALRARARARGAVRTARFDHRTVKGVVAVA